MSPAAAAAGRRKREAQKGGAKGRRKARGAGPMVVFYSGPHAGLSPLKCPEFPSYSSTILVDFVVEIPLSPGHHGRHMDGTSMAAVLLNAAIAS